MYSMAWSAIQNPQKTPRLAIGSYLETEANKVRVLEVNEETQRLESVGEVDHSFPSTKLMWRPTVPETGANFEMLASTSTTLNLYKYDKEGFQNVANFANARTRSGAGVSPPLTSFDWSSSSPHKIGASSVDSTCTIWNLEKQKIETQLIAHDKAVHDIVFAHGKDTLFASVGADGSVRLFDQRNLDHSTIIYEAPTNAPLLRLAWNRCRDSLIATIGLDAMGVVLIDIRRPSVALSALTQHGSYVNSIAWAPHSRGHLLCGTDDGFAMIWDVDSDTKASDGRGGRPDGPPRPPVVWHDCDAEVYQAVWPVSSPDHIACGMAKRVDILQL